ncbi:MAG: hypothetical protein RLO01_12035 [Thalassobaculaceae bacterium]
MKNEDTFLINYGLHSYVTHSRASGQSVFTIRGPAGDKMVRHAKGLISEGFGKNTAIRVI